MNKFFRHDGPWGGFLRSAPLWVLVLVLAKLAEEAYGRTLTSSQLVLTVSVLFPIACLAVVVQRARDGLEVVLNRMQGRLEEIFRKLRLSMVYYPGRNEQEASLLYQKATETIKFARPGATILAVNSYVEVRTTDKAPSEARRGYLAAIEQTLDTATYHRLIQVRPEHLTEAARLSLGDEINPDYLDHYRKVVEHRDGTEAKGGLTLLDAVPATYPTSFVIIRNDGNAGGRIIWQMNEHAPTPEDEEAERLTGIFIVDDPDGDLIKTFTEWFNLLLRNNARHAVQLRELDP